MSTPAWIAVAALGGSAALARFGLDAIISRLSGSGFPMGTLVVNLSGAVVLGLLAGAGVTGTALVLAGTATIGSYTTFSTWMYESRMLGEEGLGRSLLLNLAGSLVLGLLAVELGRAASHAL